MKFGIVTPVVTLAAGTHSPWERDAGPAEIRRIARRADELGYSHLTCSEHVAIPTEEVARRGGRYYDPSATLGYIAALTSRIRLLTHVLVLPYHHPLTVAKRYGTLDQLSDGRLILGVGIGSLAEEFDLLGVPFQDRGDRYEDALRALRAALGTANPRYEGSHYRFANFTIDPHSKQHQPPIWIGGRSARSLRRALLFADGWDPFGLDQVQLAGLLAAARKSGFWQTRLEKSPRFEVALSPNPPLALDTSAEVSEARSIVRTYQDTGATTLNLRFRHRTPDHYIEILERFQEQVMNHFSVS